MTWLALQVSDVLFLGLGMIFGAVLLAVAWALVKGAFPRTKASEGGQLNASHRIQERLSEFNAQMTAFQQEVSGHRTTLEDARRRLQALQAEESTAQSADATALLKVLSQTNLAMQQQLAAIELAVLEQGREFATSLHEARTDVLTQIPNRRGFNDELARRFAQWDRHQISFSLLVIDVDRFKSLNDQYGHLAGDGLLRQVARRLQLGVRQADFVCRFGGEEFAIILPNQDPTQACLAAERLRRIFVKEPLVHDGQVLPVTISGGLAMVQPGESPQSLLARADAALYASKRAGRNRMHWHAGEEIKPLTSQPHEGETAPVS